MAYKSYTESDTVKKKKETLAQTEAAKPTAYSSRWQTQLDTAMDKILNRESFGYDVNADALYRQYRDQAVRTGKLAMQDTQGQAAGLTGGYGSSYAQAAGQQQYSAHLQQLQSRIPELYQAALAAYNAEGDRLNTGYSLLSNAEDRDYSRYRDYYDDWQADRSYADTAARAAGAEDYSRYTDARDYDTAQADKAQQTARKQVDALLAKGIAPSDALIAASGYSKSYVNKLLPQKTGSTTAASAPAPQNGGIDVEKEYLALKKSGATTKESDDYLKGAIAVGLISQNQANALRDKRY